MQDSFHREAFSSRLNTNFSVIASAGSGKTRAIVDRVTAMAMQDPQGKHYLSRLAVLTYTKKAAYEMQERAFKALQNSRSDPTILHKAFFGTIHSFCLALIQNYGAYLGIPPKLEVSKDLQPVWDSFTQSLPAWQGGLSAEAIERLSSFIKISDYLTLARDYAPEAFPLIPTSSLKPLREVDLSELMHFKADKRNEASVKAGQTLLQAWQRERAQGIVPSGFPSYHKGGKAFQEAFINSFRPLKKTVAEYLCVFLRHMSESYRSFRLAKRQLAYEDLVYYAQKLLENPTAAAILHQKGYLILLDEAQDTDPQQFQLLLSLAGLWDPKKNCFSLGTVRGGAFCMVGDPQQSIYSQRASLAFYQDLQETLTHSGALEELKFTTTMRCAGTIVDAVNTIFPSILDRKNLGQVDFVPLEVAAHKPQGSVSLWTIPEKLDLDAKQKIQSEAHAIAERLARGELKLNHYGNLAILCPRRQWLLDIAEGLKAYDLPFQIHSSQYLLRDDPAYAWVSALFTVLERPGDVFEIAGVLRELYGLSDADIARYTKNFYQKNAPHPLNLIAPIPDDSHVFEALKELGQLRIAVKNCSLAQAFDLIVKSTCLEDRLDSLPKSVYTASMSLKHMALEARKKDLQQWSLGQFSKSLRQGLATEAEATPPLHNHIQLYTCHKAKGLEFEAVLLPFLSRKISRSPVEYPHLSCIGGRQDLILDPSQLSPELREEDLAYFEAELGRLLYVSFTRAKETLILVDDGPCAEDNTPCFAQFFDSTQFQKG